MKNILETTNFGNMSRLKVALLAGGNSSEREIALGSANQIAAALDSAKYDVKVIDLHYRNMTYTAPDGTEWEVDKNDFSLTVAGEKTLFEYALIPLPCPKDFIANGPKECSGALPG